jgi:NTP pyrophosphatase (non-canonical NTP hydrolase)
MDSIDMEDVYARCRLMFDADIRSPSEDGWTKLQNRLAAWQAREYGVANLAVNMTLGIVEELGELYDAKSSDELEDAVNDVTIFGSQLATCFRLDLGELVRAAFKVAHPPISIVAVGRLCHVVLKSAQGIRGMKDPEIARRRVCLALVSVFALCYEATNRLPVSLLESVTRTAEMVMARKKSALPEVSR